MSAVSWIEVSLPNAKAIFSTRLGGVSSGPYSELNLGILTDDDTALVRRNRDLLAAAIGRDQRSFAIGRQVHGSDIRIHDEPPSEVLEGDGQLTTSPAVTPLVLAADCVPLVLAKPGAVAAIHCGWRGIAAGIVTKALDALGIESGTVSAAIGPAIGACCYEVGDEVRAAFGERQLGEAFEGNRLDLRRAIRAELERSGVRDVTDAGLCTSCNPGLFFSHRRDEGVTGRQAGLAWLTS